jgi:hypothetical protein
MASSFAYDLRKGGILRLPLLISVPVSTVTAISGIM